MMAIENNVLTQEVAQNGMGAIDRERMAKAIDQVALSFGIDDKPSVDEVFTSEFLPAKEKRMLPSR
ncbi:MAG: hypothetical protein U5L06_02275 [Rhodovibrio sp.]|nr:hypothetical protein [Rhodovibrio sp.]